MCARHIAAVVLDLMPTNFFIGLRELNKLATLMLHEGQHFSVHNAADEVIKFYRLRLSRTNMLKRITTRSKPTGSKDLGFESDRLRRF
jgi:hypothetical protein